MTLAKWKMASLVLAVAVAVGVTAADKPDKPVVGPTLRLSATVKSVDQDKHTLTAVTGQKGNQEEKTYDLAKDVKIWLVDGLVKGQQKEGTLADVPPGAGAELQLSADGKAVVAVEVHGMGLHGAVQSVDPAKNQFTLTFKGADKVNERTLTLHKDGKIVVSDGLTKTETPAEGKLGDLSEGTPVFVQLAAAEKDMAVQVRVLGRTVIGTLKGVDAGTRTVTVTTKEDGSVVDKSYTLVKDARIEVTSGKSTQAGSLADLKEGDSVAVTLSVVDRDRAAYVRADRDR